LGTTFGAVHVASLEGIFITSTQFHRHSIEHIVIVNFNLLLAADIRGAIGTWEWTESGNVNYFWTGDRPLASILPGLSFRANDGELYLSIHEGNLISRMRGSLFGFNDRLVFECPSTSSATHLCTHAGTLFFAVGLEVIALSCATHRVLGRLAPRTSDPQALAALSLVDGRLLVSWGSLACVCDLALFEQAPFASLRFVCLPGTVTGLGVAGRWLVAVLSQPPRAAVLDPSSLLATTIIELPCGARMRTSLTPRSRQRRAGRLPLPSRPHGIHLNLQHPNTHAHAHAYTHHDLWWGAPGRGAGTGAQPAVGADGAPRGPPTSHERAGCGPGCRRALPNCHACGVLPAGS
jgi:hypothetical protein